MVLSSWMSATRARMCLLAVKRIGDLKYGAVELEDPQTSKYVILLQESLPNARILYSSATGASSPSNMGYVLLSFAFICSYMIRLGLWGSFSCFPSFPAFRQSLLRGGINMQEIVACDMKRMGFYLSRQISFHGSSFSIEKIRLNPEMREMYFC